MAGQVPGGSRMADFFRDGGVEAGPGGPEARPGRGASVEINRELRVRFA